MTNADGTVFDLAYAAGVCAGTLDAARSHLVRGGWLSTEVISRCYGVTESDVQTMYGRHAARFLAGRDFAVSSAGPRLWTLAGMFRFAKLFDTEQAWKVWDALEEARFGFGVSAP